jgi:hypothetical protein
MNHPEWEVRTPKPLLRMRRVWEKPQGEYKGMDAKMAAWLARDPAGFHKERQRLEALHVKAKKQRLELVKARAVRSKDVKVAGQEVSVVEELIERLLAEGLNA